jgi:hypothetical protein
MSTSPDPNSNDTAPRKQKDRAPLYTDALMEILGFDRNALEANREGYLTGAQRSDLKDDLDDDVEGLGLLMTISFGVILLMAVIMLSNGMALTPLVIGSVLFLVPLMAFAFFRQRNKRDDVQQARIRSTEGASRVYMTLPGATGHAFLQVNRKRFPISYEQASTLSGFNLPLLRVYHTENSNQILSVEVVQDDRKRKLKNENRLRDASSDSDFDFDEDAIASTGRSYDERS